MNRIHAKRWRMHRRSSYRNIIRKLRWMVQHYEDLHVMVANQLASDFTGKGRPQSAWEKEILYELDAALKRSHQLLDSTISCS